MAYGLGELQGHLRFFDFFLFSSLFLLIRDASLSIVKRRFLRRVQGGAKNLAFSTKWRWLFC
jgi:hypothetical protein